GESRGRVRPDHHVVVSRHRSCRRSPRIRQRAGSSRLQSGARSRLSRRPWTNRSRHPRRGFSGSHGRGGALCRSRPFRRASDPGGVDRLRTAVAPPPPSLPAPRPRETPFSLLYPDWALLPMVGLAPAASVIASQAVITGAYSLSRQAIQLGLLPRLEIRHTGTYMGQIYMPQVNAWLFIFVLLFVLAFRSSLALASAYGIAISGTMLTTTIMLFLVIRKRSRWPVFAVGA